MTGGRYATLAFGRLGSGHHRMLGSLDSSGSSAIPKRRDPIGRWSISCERTRFRKRFDDIGDGGPAHDVFSFSGSGRGAFIHDSTESGQVISFRSTCAWTGAATLVSSENPNNSITVAYNAVMQKGHDPCDHIVNFVVGRGTGKFANVKGSGTVRFACTDGTSGTYVDHWAGSITF